MHILDHSFAHLLQILPKNTFKIVTVHDLAPLEFSERLTDSQLQRFRKTIEKLHIADLIISVSQYSKQAVVDHLRMDPSKIRVIPMGVDVCSTDSIAEPSGLDLKNLNPYILSIGSVLSRKNLESIPTVLRALKQLGFQPNLLRVGEKLPAPLAEEIRFIIGDEKLRELGFVEERQLTECYKNAAATFIPSKLEGFGLPVLEGMVHGSPVVCSDASSLPEVGGDSALYFPIKHPEHAADMLAKILGNDAFRQSLAYKGKRRASKFSWERHREGLMEVYTRAMTIAKRRKLTV
ncbi:MAG: glycosyltransferase family 4 protein [Cyanothece sp. SIO1E1]|nr:glycosyltransferase family 4 protein [Cyanothece sp. SIO1E1]